MARSPQVHIDSIENTEEREAPRDPINNDTLSSRKELVDDGTEEKQMNERPSGRLGCTGTENEVTQTILGKPKERG